MDLATKVIEGLRQNLFAAGGRVALRRHAGPVREPFAPVPRPTIP